MKKELESLPRNPGVYIFRDEKDEIIYVGKAVNIYQRVYSYFRNKKNLLPKTVNMVEKISRIEHIQVTNELEALLLEADLIKRYKPTYNISLKDDKYYKYIAIEKKRKEAHRITTTRKNVKNGTHYYGPYPEANSVKTILKLLRKTFPFRDCSDSKFARYKKSERPCLYGHINLCPAPCISDAKRDVNNQNVRKVEQYLSGDKNMLLQKMIKDMKKHVARLEFEKAAIIRNQIKSIQHLSQSKREIKDYIEIPNLIIDFGKNAVSKLVETLNKEGLNLNCRDPESFRIEVYDVSNIQGKYATGSMVVLRGGVPQREMYRRFRIRTKDTPDDFSMMREILTRRMVKLASTDASFRKKPNLIVVDGGKGQLSIAMEVIEKRSVKIVAIGIAKKHEEIVIRKDNTFKTLKLPSNSEAIKLLQRGRDESHRFAIQYHRKLRSRSIYV